MADKILLYSSYTCPMVPPVRALLKRAGVDFAEINISTDTEARAHVRALNQGYESIPTLVFPDGSTLTEPSLAELERKLRSLGLDIPTPTPLQRLQGLAYHPLVLILGIFALLAGLSASGNLLTFVGLALIAFAVQGRIIR